MKYVGGKVWEIWPIWRLDVRAFARQTIDTVRCSQCRGMDRWETGIISGWAPPSVCLPPVYLDLPNVIAHDQISQASPPPYFILEAMKYGNGMGTRLPHLHLAIYQGLLNALMVLAVQMLGWEGLGTRIIYTYSIYRSTGQVSLMRPDHTSLTAEIPPSCRGLGCCSCLSLAAEPHRNPWHCGTATEQSSAWEETLEQKTKPKNWVHCWVENPKW